MEKLGVYVSFFQKLKTFTLIEKRDIQPVILFTVILFSENFRNVDQFSIFGDRRMFNFYPEKTTW